MTRRHTPESPTKFSRNTPETAFGFLLWFGRTGKLVKRLDCAEYGHRTRPAFVEKNHSEEC